MSTFAPHSDLTINIVPLGASGEPLLIVDNFLADPEALVQQADQSADWEDAPPGGYPGRRAGVPSDYARSVLQRVDGPIRRKLLKQNMKLAQFDCSFSLVTQKPEKLSPLQRVPHIDISKPTRVAVLHYLCGPQFGGTAFFRQDTTGFEQIGPEERADYIASRTEGLATLRDGDQYPSEATPGYTRTNFVNAQFNRLVIYRSFTLHSGIINRPDLLTDRPRTGRLTANFFVDYAMIH